jgi:serine/threonine protein kinase
VSEAPTGSRQHALAADTAVDMWSFGVITYQLLTSKLPFGYRDQPDAAALAQRILRGVYAPLSADRVRPECQALCGGALPALVERCLQIEPGRRPTAAEALEGPFFRAY